jgi:hypothetical protein
MHHEYSDQKRRPLPWIVALPLTGLALLVATPVRLTAQAPPRPTAVIGGEDDRGAALFDPKDIAVVHDRIVVLDSDAPYLKVFRVDGRLVQAFGTKGEGPAEFQAAYRFAVDTAAKRVYVYDRANARATVFALGDSLAPVSTLRLPSRLEGTCVKGGRHYAMGLHDGKLVHELEQSGDELRVVRSFGIARANHPLDDVRMFQSSVGQGRLVCDHVNGTVTAVSASTGVAQVISLTSGRQQTLSLTGLVPLSFKAVAQGGRPGVMQWAEQGYFDHVRTAWLTPRGIRLLAERVNTEDRDKPTTVTEWLLTPSGALEKSATSRQLEIGRSGASIVCYARTPYPTIEVFRATRCP